jgi:hypothetical protein
VLESHARRRGLLFALLALQFTGLPAHADCGEEVDMFVLELESLESLDLADDASVDAERALIAHDARLVGDFVHTGDWRQQISWEYAENWTSLVEVTPP